jgi:hypothetical protein
MNVVLETCPPRNYAVVGYWIQAGSAVDPEGRGGLVHFVEHLVSPHKLSQHPGVRLVTVETSLDYTGALFTLRTPDLESFLQALVQSYHRPEWSSRDFDFARNGILRELEFRDRNPVVRLQTRLLEQCFQDHPYGRPVVGTESSLRALGPADVASLMEREWRSRRTLVFVEAPLSNEKMFAAVVMTHAGGERCPCEVQRHTSGSTPPRVRVRLEVRESVNPYVVVGLPMPGAGEADYLLFLAALNLFLGPSAFLAQIGMTSPPGWLADHSSLCEMFSGVEVSLTPSRDRFVVLAGFHLRSGIDPDSFGNQLLDAIDHFRQCEWMTDSPRPLGESLNEAWSLAMAASASPWWIGGIHRVLDAPEPVLQLNNHAPPISAEALAAFIGQAWNPEHCPVGILTRCVH